MTWECKLWQHCFQYIQFNQWQHHGRYKNCNGLDYQLNIIELMFNLIWLWCANHVLSEMFFKKCIIEVVLNILECACNEVTYLLEVSSDLYICQPLIANILVARLLNKKVSHPCYVIFDISKLCIINISILIET